MDKKDTSKKDDVEKKEEISEIEKLNYPSLLNTSEGYFNKLHETTWEEKTTVSENFQLTKKKKF